MPILGTIASSFVSATANPTFELITYNILSTTTSQFSFTSIPNTYKDLALFMSVRTDRTSAYGVGYVKFEYNGDTNTSNYRYLGMGQASDSQTVSPTVANATYAYSSASSDFFNTNIFGNLWFYMPNYGSSYTKSAHAEGANEADNSYPIKDFKGYRWTGTSAITSIRVYSDNNFKANSSFFLYGIS